LSDLMRRIHAGKNLSIKTDGQDDVAFRGEKEDLEEMLGNLLDNACKWAKLEVLINLSKEGKNLIIAIEDDGAGLPTEARLQALTRGKRLDESKPGSGLGLSIVADLAELYGGELALNASPLGGLKAILNLPC
jgi:signal transduction histidine kinase